MTLGAEVTPFEIAEAKLDDGVTLISISGELDLACAPELSEKFELIPDPRAGVVIDLAETTFIDSSAIATLIELWKRTNTIQPARLSLVVAPESQPEKLLAMVGIPESIPTFTARTDAVGALTS